jgi:UDP-glucose 4-epimerase
MEDPARDFDMGPGVCFQLLDSLRSCAPTSRVLFLSSAAVYGNPGHLPVTESAVTAPLSPYGYHKLVAEFLFEEFAKVFGLRTVCLRVFSAYGPGLEKQVVFDVSRRLLTGSGVVHVQGTGAETRDFVHVRDVARAVRIILERAPCVGERYNVASGIETSIAELVALLQREAENGRDVRFDGRLPPGNPVRWRADIAKALALGFQPTIGLAEGAQEVLDFVRRGLATGD